MRKLILTLMLAVFITVGIATPILSGFLPVSDGVTVYAQDQDGDHQGEDEDD